MSNHRTIGAAHLQAFIGQYGTLKHGKLNVDVVIKDARIRFGAIDFLITPVAGWGEQWVEQYSVSNLNTPESVPA